MSLSALFSFLAVVVREQGGGRWGGDGEGSGQQVC